MIFKKVIVVITLFDLNNSNVKKEIYFLFKIINLKQQIVFVTFINFYERFQFNSFSAFYFDVVVAINVQFTYCICYYFCCRCHVTLAIWLKLQEYIRNNSSNIRETVVFKEAADAYICMYVSQCLFFVKQIIVVCYKIYIFKTYSFYW